MTLSKKEIQLIEQLIDAKIDENFFASSSNFEVKRKIQQQIEQIKKELGGGD